jgi:hypothetical protein
MVLFAVLVGLMWFSAVLFAIAVCRAAGTEQPLVGLLSRLRRPPVSAAPDTQALEGQ